MRPSAQLSCVLKLNDKQAPCQILVCLLIQEATCCQYGTGIGCRFLTGSIEEVSKSYGISQSFLGLIVLPIAGNACEHITAVFVAAKDKMVCPGPTVVSCISTDCSCKTLKAVNPLCTMIFVHNEVSTASFSCVIRTWQLEWPWGPAFRSPHHATSP